MVKKKKRPQSSPRYFPLVSLAEVGHRAGRHHKIVAEILSDLAKLDQCSAIKIDLAALGEKKASLRAALLRAAQKQKIQLATSSDEKHLYVYGTLTRTSATD